MIRDITRRLLPRRLCDHLWIATQEVAYPPDFAEAEVELCSAVRAYTMTSPERIAALAASVRYVVDNELPGSIVECGVWRGGSMMAVARTILSLRAPPRDLYLFDTFEGMSEPTRRDVSYSGIAAGRLLSSRARYKCVATLDEVAANLASTGYPATHIHLIRGKVEETLPGRAPEEIALLRLDTDWYESTLHELTHLYGRLVSRGVLIVDDYGHWQGAREAVDEFLATLGQRPYLSRIDYTARSCIKP